MPPELTADEQPEEDFKEQSVSDDPIASEGSSSSAHSSIRQLQRQGPNTQKTKPARPVVAPNLLQDEDDESTPLLGSKVKESPTVYECEDTVNANEIIQKPRGRTDSSQVAGAADELSSILSNSNALMNGGISSPATFSWIVRSFIDIYHKYPGFSNVILAMMVFSLAVYFYLTSQADIIFRQAAQIDIEEISITGVCDVGVNVHVITTLQFDYSQVSNWFNRFLGVATAFMLNKVTIKPSGPADVFVGVEGFEKQRRLARIIPPETEVRLQGGQYTILDFDTVIGVVSTSAVLLMNKIIQLRSNGQDMITLSLSSEYYFDVQSGVKNYKGVRYNIEELLSVDLINSIPKDIIDSVNFSIEDGENDSLIANVDLTTRLCHLPISLDIGSISWDMLLPMCRRDSYEKIGNVVTDEIVIEPLTNVKVSSKMELPPFASSITRSCKSKKLSPLNQFLVEFLSQNSTRNISIISAKGGATEFPAWLQFILERVRIPIPITLEQFVCGGGSFDHLIETIDVSHTEIQLQNDAIVVSSIVQVVLQYPPIFKNYHELLIKQFKSSFVFFHKGLQFAQIFLEDWQSVNLNYTDDRLIVNLAVKDLRVDVIEPNITSHLLDKFLSGKSNAITTQMNCDIDIDLPIMDTVLYDLPITIENKVPGLISNGGLSDLNTSITNIYLVDSSPQSATLLMDLEVENPLDLSVDIEDAIMDLYFASEGVSLGELRSMELPSIIPANDSFKLSIYALIRPRDFNPQTPEKGITKLEKFLSSYLSGNETNIELIGHNKSISNSNNLSQVLAGMSLEMSLPEAGLSNNAQGFIQSSTMHLMTSEIEFTVYNPINNSEVVIEIIKAQASFEGTTLGHLERQERLIIPPGIHKTPRLPITYSTGIGGNILKKLLNGDLKVQGDAIFKFGLDEFQLDLVYSGDALVANVRL